MRKVQIRNDVNNMFKAAKLQEELAFTKMPEDTEAKVFEAMLDQLEQIDLDRCYQEFPLQYDVTRDAIQEELEELAHDDVPEERDENGISLLTGCYIGRL